MNTPAIHEAANTIVFEPGTLTPRARPLSNTEVEQILTVTCAAKDALIVKLRDALRSVNAWTTADTTVIRCGVEVHALIKDALAATPETALSELAALREQVGQLKGAIELGQENCDAVYEDLRAERDAAQKALQHARSLLALNAAIEEQFVDGSPEKAVAEIAKLTHERDVMREDNDSLRRIIGPSLEDAARLDWVDEHRREGTTMAMPRYYWEIPPRKIGGFHVKNDLRSVRAAIDAAREATP